MTPQTSIKVAIERVGGNLRSQFLTRPSLVSPLAGSSKDPLIPSGSEVIAPKVEVEPVPLPDLVLPTVADELASLVALNGDAVEILARERNLEEEELQ